MKPRLPNLNKLLPTMLTPKPTIREAPKSRKVPLRGHGPLRLNTGMLLRHPKRHKVSRHLRGTTLHHHGIIITKGSRFLKPPNVTIV